MRQSIPRSASQAVPVGVIERIIALSPATQASPSGRPLSVNRQSRYRARTVDAFNTDALPEKARYSFSTDPSSAPSWSSLRAHQATARALGAALAGAPYFINLTPAGTNIIAQSLRSKLPSRRHPDRLPAGARHATPSGRSTAPFLSARRTRFALP